MVLTSFGRAMRITRRAASQLPRTPDVLELDVNRPEDFERLTVELDERWSGLDGAVHSVAAAPPEAFSGYFLETSRESAVEAFLTSAYSFKSLARALWPLMDRGPGRGSFVALDFESSRAWPIYDWLGVSKAALGAISRYLACYLGPKGIRVNLLSSGPLATNAGQAVPGFPGLTEEWQRAPLGWDPDDATPVAKAACFLLSDWAEGVTGTTLRVDGGWLTVGVPFTEIERWVEDWNPDLVPPPTPGDHAG